MQTTITKTTKEQKPLTESEVREMRDRVFCILYPEEEVGKAGYDKNWLECKEKWMTPDGIKWLIEHDFALKEMERPTDRWLVKTI